MRARTTLALLATAGTLLLAGCSSLGAAAPARPLACDDGLKAAFHPDAQTTVVAVRAVREGEMLTAVDSPQPVRAARDMCMVKLLVGPGVTAEKDRNAKSWSEGIGMEIWLPAPAGWNERIRNYGGGGWVGGGHRYPGQIGSKVPAIVYANMGYATGTHDAGQPFYQDPSFLFLSDGRVNTEAMRDMVTRAMYEQAVKTEALVRLYYGRAPRFRYYDGHSQGGRQGLKVMQEWPELYDGYVIEQPALGAPKFSLTSLYPQLVMKTELGFDATDKDRAAAFAKKFDGATARAVKACDREQLGFLLDPAACRYEPTADAGALCAGVQGTGVTGTGAGTCLSLKEAQAVARIWEGPVIAGKRLWWSLTRGSSFGGQITKAGGTDTLALAMKDARYAADASTISGLPLVNASAPPANRWRELTYASYAQVFDRIPGDPILRDYMTDQADLRKLRDLGRKVVMWNGLAEDVIPSGGAVDYYERVSAGMGGVAETRKFLRMYMMPGMAHSSQGRAWTIGGNNNAVPMPMLPGNANQTPSPAQDTMFGALADWVENGRAPGDIVLTSRDGGVSYPVCVYPQKAQWDGAGSPRQAASYRCR
jgi:feruloyl esterase